MTDAFRTLLATFAENLSARPPAEVYGRQAEIGQVLQALASPLKGRVVVIGAPRVGKTAVLYAVANALARGDGPPELRGREVWRFAPASLPGLSTPGQWQARLEELNNEWGSRPDLILCIDHITSASRLFGEVGDEGRINLAYALVTGLKRHNGLCLAEAEENAWQRLCDSFPDYARLFLPIRLAEPELDAARELIRKVADDLSVLHGVAVTAEALEQAIDLNQRYALDRAQPGKTIDLLRDALAVARPGAGAVLTADDVTRRFGEQSGLPRMLLDDSAPFNEAEVRRLFRARVLAQDQAVDAIVQILSLLRARLNNPLRPMGVLLFLGPTGVGKTELARTLAEYLYGDRERLIRFNMADYADPYKINELFGAPYADDPNARRGLITNRLAGRAFAVIVLDEFEKAHGLVYNRFLQLFDEGLLINGNDEIVNLRNSIFILTSNFGATAIERGGRLGYPIGETVEAREKRVVSETENYFSPEFINRMDAVCIFHPLTRAVMADIARREISDLFKRQGLLRRLLEVEIADEVIEYVVEIGYSPHYGARYLKRQIEKTITYPLAREINALPHDQTGGVIRLHLKNGRVLSAYFAPAGREAPVERLPEPARSQVSLDDIRAALPVLAARVEALEELYGLQAAVAERESVLAELADVNFWNDGAAARRKLDAYQRASGIVEQLGELRRALDALTKRAAEPQPALEALLRPFKFLNAELPRIEFTSFLSGPHDTLGAYVQIGLKSKAAGARRWVATLAKMYLGWAKSRGLSAGVIGEDASPEGRAASVTLALSGFGVYGLLQGETGAHRMTQAVKVQGRDSLQRFTANVLVLPELADDDLPPAPATLKTSVRSVNRSGLLLPHLSAQATASVEGGAWLTLAGNLPPDDLAAEAARLLRIRLHLNSTDGQSDATPPGGLVRSYTLNTKDKGIHDHRTGRRSLKVKQALEGDLQPFLDAALEQRAERLKRDE
jgi:ATP-dependent Clp protease ATP-binding subunit ClpA/protein subunit release factor A